MSSKKQIFDSYYCSILIEVKKLLEAAGILVSRTGEGPWQNKQLTIDSPKFQHGILDLHNTLYRPITNFYLVGLGGPGILGDAWKEQDEQKNAST